MAGVTVSVCWSRPPGAELAEHGGPGTTGADHARRDMPGLWRSRWLHSRPAPGFEAWSLPPISWLRRRGSASSTTAERSRCRRGGGVGDGRHQPPPVRPGRGHAGHDQRARIPTDGLARSGSVRVGRGCRPHARRGSLGDAPPRGPTQRTGPRRGGRLAGPPSPFRPTPA